MNEIERNSWSQNVVDASTLLQIDQRPPILYLRSFQGDEDLDDTTEMPLVIALTEGLLLTREERVIRVLNHAGPVIAIGKPGEKLSVPGAARMYISDSDSEWQNTVKNLMAKCRIAVFRAGLTRGSAWEIERAVKYLSPEKLLFWIPFRLGANTQIDYYSFCQLLSEFVPCRLPRYKLGTTFLYFDRDWSPRLGRPQTFLGLFGGGERKIYESLNVVFNRLGVKVKKTKMLRLWFILFGYGLFYSVLW